MSRILLVIIGFFFCTSCVSVKKFNERLETPVPAEKLRQDVDFTYKKLQELHPELYWYIPKTKLDSVFQDAKKRITKSLKPWGFYEILAPAIAEVRQGHLVLRPPARRYTRKEISQLKKQKGLFSRFDYVWRDRKLYVKENEDSIANMEVGSQIVKINDQPTEEILSKYKKFLTSDGLNTTYQKYALANQWPIYFTLQNGILDSVKVETLYQNRQHTFWLSREKKTKTDEKEEKLETKKYKIQKNKDYNEASKKYNRDLEFKTKDSTIAVMTVRSFSGIRSRRFYRESFQKLKNVNTKYLILDVRNNLGGSLAEISDLYRFLGSDKYPFIQDIEVNSLNAVFKGNYYEDLPLILKPIGFLFYPFYSAGILGSVKAKDGKKYLRNNLFAKKKPHEDAFRGELYLLMNGSSFSASSIIAAKLKSDGMAVLVGEETGGANDGNIAGRYSTVKLPNSKLVLPIGIMLIKPNITFTYTMKGVIPDHEILPDLADVIVDNDPEMDFILEKINIEKKEKAKLPN